MNKREYLGALFLTIVAVIFIFSALSMHPFGSPTEGDMDQYIIDNTVEETAVSYTHLRAHET